MHATFEPPCGVPPTPFPGHDYYFIAYTLTFGISTPLQKSMWVIEAIWCLGVGWVWEDSMGLNTNSIRLSLSWHALLAAGTPTC